MMIRMVKEHGGRNHYRVKGFLLDLGKEAVEIPDDVARRTLQDNPGIFEVVQQKGAVAGSELKRG